MQIWVIHSKFCVCLAIPEITLTQQNLHTTESATNVKATSLVVHICIHFVNQIKCNNKYSVCP